MEKVNVTVRLESDKVAFLDELAQAFDRDRSYLIKEAVDSYIQLHRWQMEEIKKAIDEADAGDFATDEEVAAMFSDLRR
jgi:predicted transcriptional regulator